LVLVFLGAKPRKRADGVIWLRHA